MFARDPEGILKGFRIRIGFRNDYFRKVFVKRSRGLFFPIDVGEKLAADLKRRADDERRRKEEARRCAQEAERRRTEQSRKRAEEKQKRDEEARRAREEERQQRRAERAQLFQASRKAAGEHRWLIGTAGALVLAVFGVLLLRAGLLGTSTAVDSEQGQRLARTDNPNYSPDGDGGMAPEVSNDSDRPRERARPVTSADTHSRKQKCTRLESIGIRGTS